MESSQVVSSQLKAGLKEESFINLNRLELEPGQDIDENLFCPICKQASFNPEECSQCETLFCSSCLLTWKNKNPDRCPAGCEGLFSYKRAHRIVRNKLSSLKYRCSNTQSGCEAVFNLDNRASHELACEFFLVKCINSECKETILKKNLKAHLEICEFKEEQCEKCELKFKSNLKQEHNCIKALAQQYHKLKKEYRMYVDVTENSLGIIMNKINELEIGTKTIIAMGDKNKVKI